MNRRELEEHRFSFEGATSMMARHLIDDHGVPATTISRWANGLDQGSWIALDDLHKEAHMSNELRESAQRVTGYVRAWQLLSNTDSECLGEVTVMPPGAGEPVTFKLLAADLEELAARATRCGDRVPDTSGVTMSRTCGLTLNESGACPRPREEHVAPSAPDTVVLSKRSYRELVKASGELNALHAAGVDNWEGYGEAMSG